MLQQAPRHRLVPFFAPSGPIRVASLWPVELVVQQSASSGGSQDVPGSFDMCECCPQLSPQSVGFPMRIMEGFQRYAFVWSGSRRASYEKV